MNVLNQANLIAYSIQMKLNKDDMRAMGSTLEDLIPDEKSLSPSDCLLEKDLTDQIRKLLSGLSPREEKILRLRFGIGEDGHTASLFPNSPVLEDASHLVAPVFLDGAKHPRKNFLACAVKILNLLVRKTTPAHRPKTLGISWIETCPLKFNWSKIHFKTS
jgi:hypothetical protein